MNKQSQTNRITHDEVSLFLQEIFRHEKCKNFSKEDIQNINTAYDIASRAHEEQKRGDDRPYIEHIKRTVMRFLSITQADSVDADDIIVAILHDTIEDHPKYIAEIREKFPDSPIYFRVLALSKPNTEIVTNSYTEIVRAIIQNPKLFFRGYRSVIDSANYFLASFS